MSVSATTNGVRPGVCLSTAKPSNPFIGQVIYMSDTDETAVWDGTYWEGLNRSRDRNILINGAMQIHQRGTSTASITTSGYYTSDRWRVGLASMGTWTQSVENDAPTGSGFRKSLKMLCTTADASPAATDIVLVDQGLEGQNVQNFCKGTASARSFTLSFWVKSNVTGTYIAELIDSDNTRQVSASYTITAVDTWQRKIITFPADTTGAFDNDNARSLTLSFGLGAGSNATSGTLNTVWGATTNANQYVGQTNVAAATNNYWQITGVQLEAGSVATPFEFEDIGITLRKCMRYYEKSYNQSVAPGTNSLPSAFQSASGNQNIPGMRFLVPKRGDATVSIWHWNGTANQVYRQTDAAAISVSSISGPGEMGPREIIIASSSANNGYVFHWVAAAEL